MCFGYSSSVIFFWTKVVYNIAAYEVLIVGDLCSSGFTVCYLYETNIFYNPAGASRVRRFGIGLLIRSSNCFKFCSIYSYFFSFKGSFATITDDDYTISNLSKSISSASLSLINFRCFKY